MTYVPIGPKELVSRKGYMGLGQDYASLLGKEPAGSGSVTFTGGSGAKKEEGNGFFSKFWSGVEEVLTPKPPSSTGTKTPPPPAKEGLPSWVTPVAIGALGLGAVYLLTRKKKKG